jgi:hypothetical protein
MKPENKRKMKYSAANTKEYRVRLNFKTDADIIQILEEKKATGESMQGFIKELIRKYSAEKSAE